MKTSGFSNLQCDITLPASDRSSPAKPARPELGINSDDTVGSLDFGIVCAHGPPDFEIHITFSLLLQSSASHHTSDWGSAFISGHRRNSASYFSIARKQSGGTLHMLAVFCLRGAPQESLGVDARCSWHEHLQEKAAVLCCRASDFDVGLPSPGSQSFAGTL